MNLIPRTADVVVIGGGPAGSMASGLLSSRGYHVVLLEKVKHPRNTVGESLIPHFWKFTDLLGNATQRIVNAKFVHKAGGIVRWNGALTRTRFIEFGHSRPPLHVDRDLFDKILLDTSRDCGTQVFEEVQVTRVDVDVPLKKTVHYRSVTDGSAGQIEAKFIVDASGQAAVVANQLGFRVFDEDLKFSAAWGYYKSSDYLDYEGHVHSYDDRYQVPPVTWVESIGNWGWAWNIPLRKSVSIGIILPPDRFTELRTKRSGLEARFQELVTTIPGLARLLKDAQFIDGSVRVIRDYAYKPIRLATNDCYLVGDAAAFVDPINSAGVTFGMYAAVLAAWSIERCLKDPSRREQSERMFEDQYRQRLQVFRLVALPSDRVLSDDETNRLCHAFRQFSNAEKQLALTTTIMTNRPQRVRSILKALDVPEGAIYSDVPMPVELQ